MKNRINSVILVSIHDSFNIFRQCMIYNRNLRIFSLYGTGPFAKALPNETFIGFFICWKDCFTIKTRHTAHYLSRNFGDCWLWRLSVTWWWQYPGKHHFSIDFIGYKNISDPSKIPKINKKNNIFSCFYEKDKTLLCFLLEWCWFTVSSVERATNPYKHCWNHNITGK